MSRYNLPQISSDKSGNKNRLVIAIFLTLTTALYFPGVCLAKMKIDPVYNAGYGFFSSTEIPLNSPDQDNDLLSDQEVSYNLLKNPSFSDGFDFWDESFYTHEVNEALVYSNELGDSIKLSVNGGAYRVKQVIEIKNPRILSKLIITARIMPLSWSQWYNFINSENGVVFITLHLMDNYQLEKGRIQFFLSPNVKEDIYHDKVYLSLKQTEGSSSVNIRENLGELVKTYLPQLKLNEIAFLIFSIGVFGTGYNDSSTSATFSELGLWEIKN